MENGTKSQSIFGLLLVLGDAVVADGGFDRVDV
jgi:hypothetical protein